MCKSEHENDLKLGSNEAFFIFLFLFFTAGIVVLLIKMD